jgi:hypothetical protein
MVYNIWDLKPKHNLNFYLQHYKHDFAYCPNILNEIKFSPIYFLTDDREKTNTKKPSDATTHLLHNEKFPPNIKHQNFK